MNIKETKKEISRLRKTIKDMRAEKLSLPSGDKRRIELHRKIKEMKLLLKEKKEIKAEKIIEITEINIEKDPIIVEILKLEAEQKIKPTFENLGINLHKYTLQELQIHLEKLKRKGGTNA